MDALFEQIAAVISDETILVNLVVWLSAATVFVFVLGSAVLLLNYFDPVRRRVSNVVGDAPEDERLLIKVATAIGPVATYILPQVELERDKAMLQLSRAGFRSPMALHAFYLIKTVLALVLPLIILVSVNWLPRIETTSILIYAMFASGIGLLGPNIVLRRMLENRMKALRNGFPDALDLLVVCVESGLGLAAAIQRVAEELEVSHPELAFELLLVNAEIRVGMPRERALKNLADRTGLEDIRGLVALLVQTMRFGTGVADALRVYAEEFRDKRTQKAEEQAAKMGTMLVFPLVLFMFPIFFIVAIGPAVLRIIDAFDKM
ncbi:Type II secretion system protein [uncultured Woeseiaceae bacterium]|uniref:Type II secretion system protein n=1 Tax=uncultured Woeseiaceae bacterium TaxID=1983305 RepID=A0A7D9H6Q4_9GAMM|nr:Type II secretion system protein [uncultured Woeseiaceae bacterium]